ncbi:DUF255 domain-containing protein [Halobium salinum]|uniref:DUF255 domain-containing protein n=1 Tax=Halobium salinum TaxID=1364940 RepID=A0ABD5P8J6_9EURY|nr:DUF255 domain-containing protein [Halobium salinum]
MDDDTRVEWREWGAEAFAEADRTGKPVLLSLSATWCGDCHEMDVETYAEPRIAANVNDGFVPVRVDVDRHPRVRERYNMGGFPSTVFTTPSGKLLTGATYLGPGGMRQVLDRVRETWDAKGESGGRVPRALAGEPTPRGPVDDRIEAHVAGQLGDKYDGEFAGWGSDAKFPLPRTVEFALKREREQALRTLDAITRNLSDGVAGGFFRYAGARNWGDVNHEKLLDSNAALLRAFANAYLYTGDESYRDTADAAVDFLTDGLWTGVAFGGSVGPAGGRSYYELDAEERESATGPRRDLTAYAGANALAVDALLTYHAYTDDERTREYAERTMAYLEDELLVDPESLADDERFADGAVDADAPGLAVVHYRESDEVGEAGLLADQARVAAAFARAETVLGEGLDVARDAADYALATLFDDEEGSFRDGPAAGPGLLDRPLRPLDDTVEMADALLDLAVLADDPRYREVAREAVGAFAGAWDRIGVQVAGYGAVAGRLCRDPLVVALDAPVGSDLHRAALRVADHEKVVVPNATAQLEGRVGPEETTGDAAYLLVGDDAHRAETPDDLMALVAEHASG